MFVLFCACDVMNVLSVKKMKYLQKQLLLNTKWAIHQLHHDKNKLHFNEMMMTSILY
jgi:hypothetical protein